MRWEGTHAGLLGAGGVLSFSPSKTLGAIGEAGAILTNVPAVAEAASAVRDHGRSGGTLDSFPPIADAIGIYGGNRKMDDIQAAVLLAKMARLDQYIERRTELAAAYIEGLTGAPGVLRLPELDQSRVPTNSVSPSF
jgi:dTDP-4-amino-4,6-dideoxygalactose transaminase